MSGKFIGAFASLFVYLGIAAAQTPCYFFLLNHIDFATNRGVAVDLDSTRCTLETLNLSMQTGDGNRRLYATARPKWQVGHSYTLRLTIFNGSQQMFLDGQLVGSSRNGFKAAEGSLIAAQIPSWGDGPAAYSVAQTGLEITNGSQALLLPLAGTPLPSPQNLLLGGPPSWTSALSEDPSQGTTITATFVINAPADPAQFTGYIDRYGQAASGTWPWKVNSDADLQVAITRENDWLSRNPPPSGFDKYGGSTVAGWQDTATGYFHTAYRNNRWWLISPLGNPAFYISLSGVPSQRTPTATSSPTPITGRLAEFAELPPASGQFASAYTGNYYGDAADQNLVTFWFGISNLTRKYGTQWRNSYSSIVQKRLASWGFLGMGKWSATDSTLSFPTMTVLGHNSDINVVPNGHPDVFDPAVVAQLQTHLSRQMASGLSNPYLVGWSVGNEIAENIQASEIQAILNLSGTVPAKQALVTQALNAIYGGNLGNLAGAWRITAAALGDVYNASPTPPAGDIETLRQYYEQTYYQTLYTTVKTIDPNHLYLGNWINPPSNWVSSADWNIIAANCDVIGFDYYSSQFHTALLDSLMAASNKPVMVGEFSFPANYAGQRGFGSFTPVLTDTDSSAGDLYARWLSDTSASPYVIGVSWYEYQDEPASGRGTPAGNIGPNLVYGENFAFGMVDITDQPKYDLVNKVRSANLNALQCLGLLGQTPLITSGGIVSAASLTSGVVSPGEVVTVYACGGGPPVVTSSQLDPFGRLPTLTGGTRVLFDGIPAPILYASSGQTAAVVPFDIAGQNATNVQLEYQGVASAAVTLAVTPTVPGIFTLNQTGQGLASVVNEDGTVNSPLNPAPAGSNCVLYATGLGQTSPAAVNGLLSTFATLDAYPLPVSPVSMTIGGSPALVQYAGAAPTFVAGVFQINFQVPATLPTGSQFIVLSIAGATSPPVIISVK